MSAIAPGANEPPTCHGGLENLDDEHSYWIEDIEGDLPANLKGTFWRNGPGRQRIGGTPYGHWFDGDGMLARFRFDGERVHFANRYVRTPKYIDETREQQILYRGFGTQIPGGALRNLFKMPANPANTSIMYHGGQLLALNEGGHPWVVEADSLETVGESDYAGTLARGEVFSAHGKIHQSSGHYINFGAGMSGIGWRGPKPCLNIYRIDADGTMQRKSQVPLSSFPFAHDFALTERYAVFFIGSIVFEGMGGVMLGTKSISDVVGFDESIPMRVVVVDLETMEVARQFETEPGAIIHFGNAFEEGDWIYVDGMFASDFEANATLGDVFNPNGRFNGGTYNRYQMNMVSGELRCQRVSEHESEFPTFDLRKAHQRHDWTYTACAIDNGAHSFFNAIQKVSFDGDSTLVTLPPGQYGSEPMYARATGSDREEDGYLLEVVYDAWTHRSKLQIYRCADIHAPVCVLKLPHHLPHQFHGHFVDRVFA